MNFRFAILLVVLGCSGCGWQMAEQPRYEGYEASSITSSGSSALVPPPGTVAVETESRERPPLTPELIKRGKKRYEIYCTPCHGNSGRGDGIIVKRGFPAPPSFHTPTLRQAEDLHFWSAITNGAGRMYPYADKVPPRDRWAIVNWIRVLQAAEESSLERMSPEFRRRVLQRMAEQEEES